MLPALCIALLLSDPARPLVPVATLGQATMVCRDYGRLFATPDGKRAVTRRGDWFDLDAGRQIDPPISIPDGAAVHSVLDDGTVVVATAKQLHFYPPGATKPKRTLDTLGRRTWVSGDGAVAVCLQAWADETLSLLVSDKRGEWKTVADHLPPVKRLTLNPAGTHVAVLCEGYGDVAVFDLKTKKRTDFLEERPKPASREPDGTILIQCFADNGRTDVALSADGRVVYFSRLLGVQAYDTTTGEELKEKAFEARWWKGVPAKHVGVCRQFDEPQLAWLGDGSKHVRVTDGGVLRTFDTATSKQTDTHSTYPGLYGVTALDDRRAMSWTEDGRLLTWDLATGKPTADVQLADQIPRVFRFADVTLGPDAKELTARCGEWAVHADATSGRKLFDDRPLQPVFGPDGRLLIYRPFPGTLSRPGSDTPLVSGVEMSDSAGQLHFDPSGRVAVVVMPNYVTVVEMATSKRRWSGRVPDEHRLGERNGMILTSGVFGRRLVVVRRGGVITCDLSTHKFGVGFALDADEWKSAAISADGRWLAVAPTHSVRAPRTLTLYPLDHPDPPAAAVELRILPTTYTTGLAFTPDGKRLLTSHAGGTAHVWDIARFTSDAESPRASELWAALGSDDGEEVGKCMAELVQAPRVAVAMIGRRLPPAERIDEKAAKARIVELGSADFRTREAATQALTAQDERIVPLLKAFAAANAVPEVADRLERVRAVVEARDPPADWPREARAVEVLEAIGGKDAERLLTLLAAGAPGARLTDEAARALSRLAKRR